MLSKIYDLVKVRRKLVMGKGAQIVATSAAGVETPIDMTELAALNNVAAADIQKIDGITNGTGAADKALVLGASGEATVPGPLKLNGNVSAAAGAGITGGTGTVCKSSVVKRGDVIHTQLIIDLTGLGSSTTDLDIIGQGASAAYLTQVTAAVNGTIFAGRMTCLEAPATGVADIDLYAATENTGVFDGGIAALVETALVTAGGSWTAGTIKEFDTVAADKYLYLTGGAGGTAGTYTAGKFIIDLYGY